MHNIAGLSHAKLTHPREVSAPLPIVENKSEGLGLPSILYVLEKLHHAERIQVAIALEFRNYFLPLFRILRHQQLDPFQGRFAPVRNRLVRVTQIRIQHRQPEVAIITVRILNNDTEIKGDK
jgi:hypothetical protein